MVRLKNILTRCKYRKIPTNILFITNLVVIQCYQKVHIIKPLRFRNSREKIKEFISQRVIDSTMDINFIISNEKTYQIWRTFLTLYNPQQFFVVCIRLQNRKSSNCIIKGYKFYRIYPILLVKFVKLYYLLLAFYYQNIS